MAATKVVWFVGLHHPCPIRTDFQVSPAPESGPCSHQAKRIRCVDDYFKPEDLVKILTKYAKLKDVDRWLSG